MAAAVMKKALVFPPTVAVDTKVPEICKYGMSDWSGFESDNEKDYDFQHTKKQCTKLSASKGKQGTLLKRYCWKCVFRRVCFENTVASYV